MGAGWPAGESLDHLHSTRLSCEATICHAPSRFSHVSVQICKFLRSAGSHLCRQHVHGNRQRQQHLQSRPLWRFMFSSKRVCNTPTISSVCFFERLDIGFIPRRHGWPTNHPVPFPSKFAAYIFSPSTLASGFVWLRKNKRCIPVAVPGSVPQMLFSTEGFHPFSFEILEAL
jgi:hypothetical protein